MHASLDPHVGGRVKVQISRGIANQSVHSSPMSESWMLPIAKIAQAKSVWPFRLPSVAIIKGNGELRMALHMNASDISLVGDICHATAGSSLSLCILWWSRLLARPSAQFVHVSLDPHIGGRVKVRISRGIANRSVHSSPMSESRMSPIAMIAQAKMFWPL